MDYETHLFRVVTRYNDAYRDYLDEHGYFTNPVFRVGWWSQARQIAEQDTELTQDVREGLVEYIKVLISDAIAEGYPDIARGIHERKNQHTKEFLQDVLDRRAD